MKKTIVFPIFILLIAMSSIQIGASLAKQLFPLIGVMGTAFLRLAIASFLLIAFCRPWRGNPTRVEWFYILLYGVALSCMNLFFYLAIERIPLGITVALEFIGPLFVSLISSRRAKDFLWLILATLGISLITLFSKKSTEPLDHLGIAFALLAALSWGLYMFFGKKAVSSIHGAKLVTLGMTVAALICLPVFFIFGSEAIVFNSKILFLAFVVAALSSALPYFLEILAMKALPLKTFGVLMSIEPAFAALSGFIFLREHLSFVQWGAIGCIMAASIGCSIFSKPLVEDKEIPFV